MGLTKLQVEEYNNWKVQLSKMFNVDLVLGEDYDSDKDEVSYFRFSDMLKRLDTILD